MNAGKKLIAVVVLAALAYPLVYAQAPKIHDLERQGFELAARLKQLTTQNEKDPCAGDVSIAATYIELAVNELRLSKHPAALTSLAYGQNELKEISKNRAYCAHLAARIEPYVEEVSSIKRELEREPFPEEDIPDSCIKK